MDENQIRSMHPTERLIQRLARVARRAPERPTEMPYGFAGRIVSQLGEPDARDWTLWLLPRAAAVAALLSLLALGWRLESKPNADFRDLAADYVQNELERGL